MLVRFHVKNFRSIATKQELTFVAAYPKENPESLVSVKVLGESLVRVAAIYGANASGKSNMLRAMRFFRSAIANSQTGWTHDGGTPVEAFAFNETSPKEPTEFSSDFLLDGVRFEYGFTLNKEEIISENLVSYPKGRRQIWFERERNKPILFGPILRRANRGLNDAISRLVRPNSLFLSAAVQNNHELLNPIFEEIVNDWISILGSKSGFRNQTAELAKRTPLLKEKILQYLRVADLGLVGFDSREEEMSGSTLEFAKAMMAAIPSELRPSIKEEEFKVPKITFDHRAAHGTVALDSSDESDGTIAYFSMLGPICDALAIGRLVIVDEIDASLHPKLTSFLVHLFNDPTTNPQNAQLVFTTHSPSLLGECALRRDQVWLTEKDSAGSSHLIALSDFKVRREDNLEKGYLEGRFGGIPSIDWTSAREEAID